MIRLEAVKMFTLSRYNELKDMLRKNVNVEGQIYVGDKFSCGYDLAKYLVDNQVVKIMEVMPSEK